MPAIFSAPLCSRLLRSRLVVGILGLCATGADGATTAFVNVNVVPMTAADVLRAQTVIVDAGRIRVIGPVNRVPVPERAAIVDGTDRYLMPGLADMHAHVPRDDGAELERVLTLFAVRGVTSVRGMLGAPPHLELREALAAGERFGPTLITSGPSLNGNSVRGADDARRQVAAQAAAGYDFLKIHPGLDRAEFGAIAAAAARHDIAFAGHVPAAVGLSAALAAGIATIDHLDGYLAAMLPPQSPGNGGYGGFFGTMLAADVAPERLDGLVAETVRAGTWNVPTETLVEYRIDATPIAELAARAEMAYVPPATLRRWREIKASQLAETGFDAATAARAIALRRELIVRQFRANGRILLGSDAPQVFNVPGFATHRELALYVAAGLSPYEALRTGTVAVADFLGSDAGRVEVGWRADLLLVDDDPLADIRNAARIHGVMLRGRWYGESALEARLEALRNPE